MNEFSSCTKCAFETIDPVTFCRQCGSKMVSSARIRKLGRFSVVVGALLVVMMLFVIFFEARAMLPGSDTRYTGTHAQALLMFLLEGDVIAFGAVSALAGLWQIKHGRRNKKLLSLVIGLAVVAVLLCLAFNNASGHESGD